MRLILGNRLPIRAAGMACTVHTCDTVRSQRDRMSSFVNLTNHPVAHWGAPQRAAAEAFGAPIVDLPFPIVSPTLAVEGLVELVDQTLRLIPDGTGIAMVAGEHTLTFALVAALQRQGIVCVAATSERRIELGPDGEKRVEFCFERFREYPGNPVRLPAPQSAVATPPAPATQPAPATPPVLATQPAPATPPVLATHPEGTKESEAPEEPDQDHVPRAAAVDDLRRNGLLDDIFRASWQAQDPTAAINEMLNEFPGSEDEVAWERHRGELLHAGLSKLETLLRQYGPSHEVPQTHAKSVLNDFHFARHLIERQFKREIATRQRARERQAVAAAGGPLTTVRAQGDHRIEALAPASGWALYVDETGQRFDDRPDTTPGRHTTPGRMVSLLVPDGVVLPKLAHNFHATTSPDAVVDAAVQGVLNAPVGVFGLPVDALGPAPGDRWSDAVLEVIAWVARLMPLTQQGRVVLDVHVEQRGGFQAGERWRLGVRTVLRRLSEVAPARAARLDLSIRTVSKDGSTPLGQVDALAFTWGSPSPASGARFRATGLAETCCVDVPPDLLRAAWQGWGGVNPPDGPTWRRLLAASGDERTFVGRLMDGLAAASRAQPALWATWVHAAAAHLDSKAVDLRAVGREVAWLNAAAPEGQAVPERLQLMWLVAQLAEGNHRGALDPEDLTTLIGRLGDKLYEEDPALVCLADLHRAVVATNALDLDAAAQAIARWKDAPPALPGLQMWGRLQSTLGQHHAFRGQLQPAQAAFTRALDGFNRLSDPGLGRLESSQTGTYLAIVRMDDPTVDTDTARSAIESVIGPMDAAIPRLSASNAPADKYAQHLMLRWLATRGNAAEVARWQGTRNDWKLGDGHPWPLIAFYRALLLDRHNGVASRPTVTRLAAQAVHIAEAANQGPTVRLIGATIAAASAAWGVGWDHADAKLAALREDLPLANIDAIASFLDTRTGDPMGLLRAVLPFNFR